MVQGNNKMLDTLLSEVDKEDIKARFREKSAHRSAAVIAEEEVREHDSENDEVNDNDDEEETVSLVSEYGSDTGQYSYRLDQVAAMEAIQEDEDDGEEDENEYHEDDENDENDDENEGLSHEEEEEGEDVKQEQEDVKQEQDELPHDLKATHHVNLLDKDYCDFERNTKDQTAWISQCIQDLQILSENGELVTHTTTTHKDRMNVLQLLLQQNHLLNCGMTCNPTTTTTTTSIQTTPTNTAMDVIYRLDRELALCRAEIGRLHNAARKEFFVSPDKAILDDEETSDSSSSGDDEAILGSFEGPLSPQLHTTESTLLDNNTHVPLLQHLLLENRYPVEPSSLTRDLDVDLESTVTETISNLSSSWNLYPPPEYNSFYEEEEETSSMTEDNNIHPQSYQRVIMAPPGLIGITFVDFCGKAMVSHVSYDSPLHGWIFLQDILIAIDECIVSDMQVKDIVQLLLHRKDKQRALVIMSTHAMTTTLSTREPSEIMI